MSMLKLLIFIIGMFIGAQSFGQDSSKLWKFELGINLNYSGNKIPDFISPFGMGIGAIATLNKFENIKPTIELNVIGFPEFVIGSSYENHASFTMATLLIGTKYMFNKRFGASITIGPSTNSIESFNLAVKPSIEIHTKNNKISFQLYYTKLINSQAVNGYAGLAILFKII
jgi:hypothetical protein